MPVMTGLSGNEIYCLAMKGFTPGNLVVGNSVHALGLAGALGSGFKSMFGGELKQITSLIEEGRAMACQRMMQEAWNNNATGITGVDSQLVFHGTNMEFLSIGSAIHKRNSTTSDRFSSSANGQELYAQLDTGFKPVCFAFGNVAYSPGLGRGLIGGLKTLGRGEIKEYSDIFNKTRHLALNRIIRHAMDHKANAVLGIQTSILPFGGVSEMLMIGTASFNPALSADATDWPVSSDMTNIEMWNMANLGFVPVRLLLGTSVYSLGLAGGITSVLKSFVRGEINELTRLVYEARENALSIIYAEATSIGADDIVGVKTYVYQLGNGLIEFLAIGTAVKKTDSIKVASSQLPPQAIISDQNTFFDSIHSKGINVNAGIKPINRNVNFMVIVAILFAVLFFRIFIRG